MATAAGPDQVATADGGGPAALSIRELARPHWPRLLGGCFALGVVAISSALYAYLAGPLLALLLSGGREGGGLLFALLPAAVQQQPVTAGGRSVLVMVAVALAAIALVKGLAQLAQAVLLDVTAERIGHGLRVRLYGHLLRRPLITGKPRPVGELIARLLDDVRRVQQATVGAAIGLLRDGLAALALLFVALWLSVKLTLLALVALPLVGLAISLIWRRVRAAAARGQGELGRLSARASAGLAALREVKSCGAEERELAHVERRSRAVLCWVTRRIRAKATGPLVNEVLAAGALGVTLVYASGQVATGALPAERVISFLTAVLLLYRPIKGISTTLQTVAAGRASIDRVAELLAEAPERPAGRCLPPLERGLTLRQVRFKYPDGGWELAPVDLELSVGRVVAVAGPSGAGKTTLANLVCGLVRPSSGVLCWDDVDLGERPLAELRAAVALVPQQPLLLDGSLEENLRFGAPDVTESELWEALSAAALADWVRGLSRGILTVVGPGARAPSVGQLQRLSVARALLRGTRVVVLDEPTSALDSAAAAHLGETIRATARRAAVMVVAHGRGLLDLADEVVWLRGSGGLLTATEERLQPARPDRSLAPGPPSSEQPDAQRKAEQGE